MTTRNRHRRHVATPDSGSSLEAHSDDVPGQPQGDPVTQQLDTWFKVFTGVMRMSGDQTAALRDELEDHLRSRVTDLMLDGMDAAAATRHAVDELGEAVGVAERFRVIRNENRRRRFMNGAILGVAVVGLGLGASSLSVSLSEGPYRGQKSIAPATLPTVQPVEGLMLSAQHDTPLADFFERLGAAADRPVYVHFDEVAGTEAFDEQVVGAAFERVSLAEALTLINEFEDRLHEPIGVRVRPDMIEVSTRRHFDLRTITLRSYDVEMIVHAGSMLEADETGERLASLITELVEPDSWYDNGGELARLTIVGNTMFVHAPDRFFPQIEWVLEQLTGTPAEEE